MINDCLPGCSEHYACKLRNQGLQISPRATPNRAQNWRPTPSIPDKTQADLMYDTRADGSKMPILNPNGTHMRRYDYNQDRRKVDEHLRRIHSAP